MNNVPLPQFMIDLVPSPTPVIVRTFDVSCEVSVTVNDDGSVEIDTNDPYYSTTITPETFSEIIATWNSTTPKDRHETH